MTAADGWHRHPGIKGTETAQNRPKIPRDREQSALDTYLMNRFQAGGAESAISGIVRKIIYVGLAIAVLPIIWQFLGSL